MPDSVKNLVAQAAAQLADHSPSPELDAEVLLCRCLRKPRSYLRAWPEQTVAADINQAFQALIAQRQQGLPIAYLTGSREFWSRDFYVNQHVLIPRPDTELLIELSLQQLPVDRAAKIIDLGVGSGIVAITLAAERPHAQVIGVDKDRQAIAVAEKNAAQWQTANLRLLVSDWFTAVPDTDFDLIVSNPPYIAAEDQHLQQGDVRFEPRSALISPENGLQDIRLIAEQARNHLKPGGRLLIEHGYDQPQAVQTIFSAFNYQAIATHSDLSGQPRVTSGLWNPS